jgi:LysR family transcriptional regulator, hypochlorite-specific transcription factor HypT
MLMNLSWIDDFMTLAATGNFSRAAEERHMTQPAFSRRIRALEEWLGVDLFDRSSQPARVTEVGQWFRTVAQDLQSQVASIPGEARAIAEASSRTLRFAATHALSFTFVPRWLHALEAQASIGQLQLMSDVQQKCETLLMQNQVHLMITHGHPAVRGPLDEADFPSVVIGNDQLIPVSAPGNGGHALHSLTTGSRGSPVHWLDYSAESGIGRILRELKGPALDRLHVHPVMTAHLASVLRTMALDKRGLAWLPRLLVEDDMATGRLVAAAPDEWRIDLQIRLYRQRSESGKAAEAFWKAAKAEAQTT